VALMVIDSSAIIAIMLNEPERAAFDRQVEADPIRRISAVGRVEAGMVIEARKRDAGRRLLNRFLHLTAAEIVAVTPEQADAALEAFRRFGTRRHRAALNIGDRFAYAAARSPVSHCCSREMTLPTPTSPPHDRSQS
jgi:ribonuclease VapC